MTKNPFESCFRKISNWLLQYNLFAEAIQKIQQRVMTKAKNEFSLQGFRDLLGPIKFLSNHSEYLHTKKEKDLR